MIGLVQCYRRAGEDETAQQVFEAAKNDQALWSEVEQLIKLAQAKGDGSLPDDQ